MKARRLPVRDEYAEAGEAVVMLDDGRVVALSSLATAVLAELGDEEVEANDLARALVKSFGAPPGDADGNQATREALDALSALGLVDIIRA